MEFVGSISCAQCGSPVGTSSGRCPFCGAELSQQKRPATKSHAAPVGYSEGALRYRKANKAKSKRNLGLLSKPVLALFGVGGLLLVIGVALPFIRGGNDVPVEAPPPPPPRPAPAPGEIRVQSPREVAPDDFSAAALHRAREFSSISRLLSISAAPVVGDYVDLTAPDAQVVYTYYADKQDPARAPNAKSGRFVVTIDAEGAKQADFPPAPSDAKSVVDEPLCVFSAAIRAGRASGIPEDAPIHAVYELDPGLRRAIWKLTVPEQKELTRLIDGQSCAIVANRR